MSLTDDFFGAQHRRSQSVQLRRRDNKPRFLVGLQVSLRKTGQHVAVAAAVLTVVSAFLQHPMRHSVHCSQE